MICPKCGFESETNFCPMCGADMNKQPVAPTAQPSIPFTQNIPNNQTQYINTPSNQGNPYIQNSQTTQQNIQPNPYMQNTPPVQNISYSQQQAMPNMTTTNNMQSATPPVMQSPEAQSKPTGKIVLCSILGAVMLVGTVLFSFSCVSGTFEKEKVKPYFEYEPDYTDHHTGDEVNTSYGKITLKSMENIQFEDSEVSSDLYLYGSYPQDSYDQQYQITFTIQNTSGKSITVSADDFSVSYLDLYSSVDCPKLKEAEDEYPQSLTIKSGETKDFSVYYYVSSKAYILSTRYKYFDEANSKRYSLCFSDTIEYTACEDYPCDASYPQDAPFGTLTVTTVEPKAEKDDKKTYEVTLRVLNNAQNDIEVSTKDFGIKAYNTKQTINARYLCLISNDETVTIKPHEITEITLSTEIYNDCDNFYLYYKFNNHITSPDKAVDELNYNFYWTVPKT